MPVEGEGFRSPGPSLRGRKLKRLNHVHRAMAHVILANPAVKVKELAALFGVSEGWTAAVLSSEPFQKYLEGKTERIMDPLLRGEIGESFRGLLIQALERTREKMDAAPSDGFVLQVLQSASKALGYGNSSQVNVSGSVSHAHSLVSVLSSLPPAARSSEKLIEQAPVPVTAAADKGPI